jgi:hypothetical protein
MKGVPPVNWRSIFRGPSGTALLSAKKATEPMGVECRFSEAGRAKTAAEPALRLWPKGRRYVCPLRVPQFHSTKVSIQPDGYQNRFLTGPATSGPTLLSSIAPSDRERSRRRLQRRQTPGRPFPHPEARSSIYGPPRGLYGAFYAAVEPVIAGVRRLSEVTHGHILLI